MVGDLVVVALVVASAAVVSVVAASVAASAAASVVVASVASAVSAASKRTYIANLGEAFGPRLFCCPIRGPAASFRHAFRR